MPEKGWRRGHKLLSVGVEMVCYEDIPQTELREQFRWHVEELLRQATEEWAASRKRLPRLTQSGRVWVTLMYFQD